MMTDITERSVLGTKFAMFRVVKTSPGPRPMIWLAGTRLSEQPIYLGYVRDIIKWHWSQGIQIFRALTRSELLEEFRILGLHRRNPFPVVIENALMAVLEMF